MKKTLMTMGLIAGMLSPGCGPEMAGAPKKVASLQEPLTTATRLSPQDLFRGLFFGRGPAAVRLPQIWSRGMPGAPKPEANLNNEDLARRLDEETAALGKAGLDAQAQGSLHGLSGSLSKDTLTPAELNKQVATDTASDAKTPIGDTQINGLLSAIAKTDPTFFDRFSKEIQSGDPLSVAAAVAESGVKLINATALYQNSTGAPLAKEGFAEGLMRGNGEGIIVIVDGYVTRVLITDVVVAVQTVVVVNYFLIETIFLVAGDRDFGNTGDLLRHEAWMKLIAEDLSA